MNGRQPRCRTNIPLSELRLGYCACGFTEVLIQVARHSPPKVKKHYSHFLYAPLILYVLSPPFFGTNRRFERLGTIHVDGDPPNPERKQVIIRPGFPPVRAFTCSPAGIGTGSC